MLGCRYVRPQFASADEEPQLVLRAARHPVLDAVLEGQAVPNDVELHGGEGPRALIVTGPNMGGKSCYIRAAALIAIMAQARLLCHYLSRTLARTKRCNALPAATAQQVEVIDAHMPLPLL